MTGAIDRSQPPARKEWNLDMVRAREALAMLKQRTSHEEIDWADLLVAHIDTGYTRHPVFRFRKSGTSPFLLGELGKNFKEYNADPEDPLDYSGHPGHGTRTCSVLCGNLPGRFVGVAPSVPTVPYRVTNTVLLSEKPRRARVAQAIRHAHDENSCDVVSISLGWPVLSWWGGRPLGEAVDYAYDHGIIVIAAGGQFVDVVVYPAKFRRAIGVGGVKADRSIYFEYANDMKDFIDVWAPAGPIFRADAALKDDGTEDYCYDYGDGTSYAAAHVSAAAAMWLTYRAIDIENQYTEPWHRVEALRTLLKKTCQRTLAEQHTAEGTGILDIKALLDADLPNAGSLVYEGRLAKKQFL